MLTSLIFLMMISERMLLSLSPQTDIHVGKTGCGRCVVSPLSSPKNNIKIGPYVAKYFLNHALKLMISNRVAS